MYWIKTDQWYLERVLYLLAGIFALSGTLLAWLLSPWWLLLTGLVGINLIVFALTGFCAMANLVYFLGGKPRLEAECKGEGTVCSH